MADPAQRDQTVAVLMDFENTKDANLQRVLSVAAGFGQVIVRRAYADWSRHANAQNRLRESGFEAVHQFTTGAGSKNATDINLTVDAMDILWSRPVDIFVLVTADSDFAKLAMRLREGGKRVIGIGAKGRVGRALVQACDQYNYYDEGGQKTSPTRRGRGRGRGKESEPKAAQATTTSAPAKANIGPLHVLVVSCFEAAADEDGWVYGSDLHRTIRRLHPDFSYRDHGYASFRSFIESLSPVLKTETDEERSDFLVWIDDTFEKRMWEAVEAQEAASGEPEQDPDQTLVLADDVQDRIHDAWVKAAGNRGRLQGSKAGTIVATEYGAERLRDTPLVDLDGVLAAAPKLAAEWKRERATMVRR